MTEIGNDQVPAGTRVKKPMNEPKRKYPKVGRGECDAAEDSALARTLRERFGLSRMEAVVACGLVDGFTYEEIAESCCISYHTVHSHVNAIHRKTGVKSNARLLALILRGGLS